jgi:hypothetical protein
MGWRVDEVWFDVDVLWFREQPRRPFAGLAAAPAFAGDGLESALLGPVATGLEASRRRRQAWQAARRRRRTTRTVPAVALVLGTASMVPVAALRNGVRSDPGPLPADPPSLTFRFDESHFVAPEIAPTRAFERVEWRRATAIGLPYDGHLVNGTRLPTEGSDWVTWNPTTDSVANDPARLYGHERTIRTVISVVRAYRAAHPAAPRVVVGDISFRHGRQMEEHVSHQNGLDVDVYYPRLDGRLRAPVERRQIDRRLAQDLLDRFVAAGAQIVFVGYSSGLRGPSGVVVPYPRHENHMHIRFPAPPG